MEPTPPEWCNAQTRPATKRRLRDSTKAFVNARDQSPDARGPAKLINEWPGPAVFDALAHDDELLALAADVPPDKLPALLFAASACYLIADREPDGLIGYFPSAGGPQPAVDAGFNRRFELSASTVAAKSPRCALAGGIK